MSDSEPTTPPAAGATSGSRPGAQPSGRPGGYTRSVSGLVGALIILFAATLVFVGFRGIVRDNPDAPPLRAIAYAQVVRPAAEQTGWPVAAPQSLPQGWVATSVRWNPPSGANWHLGLLTDDQEYVGIEQSVATLDTMVESFVGEEAEAGGPIDVPRPARAEGLGGADDGAQEGSAWTSWTGTDGDVAATTTLGDQTLLVVTSGTAEQLRSVLTSLTLQG